MRWCSPRSSSWRSAIWWSTRSAASSAPGWAWAVSGLPSSAPSPPRWRSCRGTSTCSTLLSAAQGPSPFYVGATLLVVGSWIWCGVMIASCRVWRANPTARVPLAAHGMLSTVRWSGFWRPSAWRSRSGLLILPWSLGLVAHRPIVARTYFWWFGHPLTYFWLVPAYVLWYTLIPQVAGGKLFSDAVTRVVFVQFILFSTPVGFHHQFTDPGIAAAGSWSTPSPPTRSCSRAWSRRSP